MKFIHTFCTTLLVILFSLPVLAAENCGVILQDANLRTGPGTKYRVHTALLKGTKVEKITRQSAWLQIKIPGLSKTGWVHHQLVKNQQCKKFAPMKTLKPSAKKTPTAPAAQAKQVAKAPAELALQVLQAEGTEDNTVLAQAPPKENVAKVVANAPPVPSPANTETSNPDSNNSPPEAEPPETARSPEPKTVPAFAPQIDEPNVADAVSSPPPLAKIGEPALPSGKVYKRPAKSTSVIGVIDIQKVINESQRGKAAREKYEHLRLAGQRENIDLAEEELITNVIVEIQAIVETFAMQHGFTHILNKNSGAIFFNDKGYSITDDIIREYDRQVGLKRLTP